MIFRTTSKKEKLSLILSSLCFVIILGLIVSVSNAEMNIIEIPLWFTKDEPENPLSSDNISLFQAKVGILVPSATVVKGRLSSNLDSNEHLWIAVKPFKSIENWWPQSGGPLPVVNNEFEGNAFLGGKNGDVFEIAILIVEDEVNQKFLDWENQSRVTKEWPPITGDNSDSEQNISKEDIENRKYANITAILFE
jgi:hypothetical protein